MAQGENAKRYGRPGMEYWTSRHPKITIPGKETKKLTHKYERRVKKKKEVEKKLRDEDIDMSMFFDNLFK